MHAVMGRKQGRCVGEGGILEDPRLDVVVHLLARAKGDRHGETAGFVFAEKHVGILPSSRHVRLEVVQDVVPGRDCISSIGSELMLMLIRRTPTYIIGARWNHMLAFPRFIRAVRSVFFEGNDVLKKIGSVWTNRSMMRSAR